MPKVTQSAPIFTKNSILQITTQEQSDVTHWLYGGERGIRTPGRFPVNGFQVLCHFL